MKRIAAVIFFGCILIGCNSLTIPMPKTEIKNTGWVKIVHGNYLYHKTLQWPDGTEREFYHCEANGGLEEEGETVAIQYTGDGSSMESCAKNLIIQESPSRSNNKFGKKIWFGTKRIKGMSFDQQQLWLKPDASSCGTVDSTDNGMWDASAFEDMSVDHYFSSRDEATKWIVENWCKP